jgi:hypothetical protein
MPTPAARHATPDTTPAVRGLHQSPMVIMASFKTSKQWIYGDIYRIPTPFKLHDNGFEVKFYKISVKIIDTVYLHD